MRFPGLIRRILPAILLPALSMIVAKPAVADEPPPIAAYGALPGIEDMSISPSGAGLAMVGRLDGKQRQLAVFDAERKVRAVSPIGDQKLRYIRWIGEDTVLVVTSATIDLGPDFAASKTELYGGIIVPLKTGKVEMVFGDRPSLAKAIFGDYGTRLVDGKWLGYFGAIELKPTLDRMGYAFDHGRPALYGVNLDKNASRKVAPSPSESLFRRWLIDGAGSIAAVLDRNHVSGRWQIANQRGTVIASGVDPTGDVGLVSLGRDGTTLIYAMDDEKEGKTRWLEVPLAGGTPQDVFAGIDIDRTYVDPRNGRLLGYLQGGPDPKPILFDPAHQAVVSKVYRAFPKLDLRIVEWTPDFTHFLVHTSGNGDSGTWFVIDMVKRRADPVGHDYPLIGAPAVGTISTFAYKATDGLDLDGILTLPPGRDPRNLPVVMLPHGGPNAHDEAAFDWWAQAFAARGYAVFQPNFRGSTNRDDAFRRAGNGQ